MNLYFFIVVFQIYFECYFSVLVLGKCKQSIRIHLERLCRVIVGKYELALTRCTRDLQNIVSFEILIIYIQLLHQIVRLNIVGLLNVLFVHDVFNHWFLSVLIKFDQIYLNVGILGWHQHFHIFLGRFDFEEVSLWSQNKVDQSLWVHINNFIKGRSIQYCKFALLHSINTNCVSLGNLIQVIRMHNKFSSFKPITFHPIMFYGGKVLYFLINEQHCLPWWDTE